MAYDPIRQRVVMFGGWGSGTETWEWDGTDWKSYTPAVSPSFRAGHAMAYSVTTQRVLLFGGGQPALGDTWEWDGATWRQVLPAVSPPSRYYAVMAEDTGRGRMVLFGGRADNTTHLSDTWEWDGVGWARRLPGSSPSARAAAAAAYDPLLSGVLMFGGTRSGTYLGDTWLYQTIFDASYYAYGQACDGSAGMPSLDRRSADLPWIGDDFTLVASNLPPGQPTVFALGSSDRTWGGLTLPLPLNFIGMKPCVLLASLDVMIPASNWLGLATLTLSIPNDPTLLNQVVYGQTFVGDPPTNTLGVIATNAGGMVVGQR